MINHTRCLIVSYSYGHSLRRLHLISTKDLIFMVNIDNKDLKKFYYCLYWPPNELVYIIFFMNKNSFFTHYLYELCMHNIFNNVKLVES